MSSAWLPIRTVNLMGAPPDSWLDTISIGRSPSYFSFNNRVCHLVAIPWAGQLKTVQNFSDIPEETDAWFEQLRDFLARSTTLADQGQPHDACLCFGLLYDLIAQMERGEEIVFAEEVGSWMIPGDEKVYLQAYIHALVASTTPEAFTEAVI